MAEDNTQKSYTFLVGQLLKEAREARGLTLEAIGKILRISKTQLRSLEESNENIVCDVYTLGFLRSYAKFLGLDEKELSKKFKEQALHPQHTYPRFPAPLPERGMPSMKILGLSGLVLLFVIAGWQWLNLQKPAPSFYQEAPFVKSIPNLNEQSKQTLNNQSKEPLLTEDLQTKQPEKPQISLVEEKAIPVAAPLAQQSSLPLPLVHLTVIEEAWIEVKDNEGHTIMRRLFRPGENYEFKYPQNLTLKTGNSRGTQLTSGAKKLIFSEEKGIVRSNISLDPEKWVEETSKTQ